MYNTLKKTPSSGKSLISTYSLFGGWSGGGRLFEFEWRWEGSGVGANSRLGAYSNKYGISDIFCLLIHKFEKLLT